jgi:hypothetical protein
VAFEDDQTAIFHSNSAQIHFPVSKKKAFIFTSHYHDDVMKSTNPAESPCSVAAFVVI